MPHDQKANENTGLTRAQGRRKSRFPGLDNIPSEATLDFVSGGTNFKIPLAAFLTALNVTGTIEQTGDPTAAPVLDVQGAANLIRNIETGDGSGLKAQISPQNGLQLSLDAQSIHSGVDVLQSDNTIRGILAGSGIAVVVTNGDVRISLSAIPGASRVVVVTALSDFPAPIGGVITLEADTVYFLNDVVNVGANVFVLQNNTLVTGLSSIATGIVSSGVGSLFSNNGGFRTEISLISIDAPNCTIFSLNFPTAAATLVVVEVSILQCVSICSVTNCSLVNMVSSAVGVCTGDAFKFLGQCDVVQLSEILVNAFTGTFFDLDSAVFDRFRTSAIQIASATGANVIIQGLAGSANLSANGRGRVDAVIVNGPFTDSSTVFSSDVEWDFTDNTFAADSVTNALLSLQGNATETVIAVMGTPVLVAGTWVVDLISKMTATTGGRATYNEQSGVRLHLTAGVTVEPVSGATQILSVYVAVNGVFIPNSQRSGSADSGDGTSITVPWFLELETNDFIEIFVANESATTNILVSSAVLDVG